MRSKKIRTSTGSECMTPEFGEYEKDMIYNLEACKNSHCDDGINVLYVLSIEENCWDELATILFNLGVVYHKMNVLDEALNFYSKSISSTYCLQNDSLITANLHNLGNIYYIKKEFKKALQLYSEAIKFRKNIKIMRPSILHCICNWKAKLDEEEDEVSMQHLKESLEIKISSTGSFFHPHVAEVFDKMGQIFARNRKTIEAKEAFQLALSILEKLYEHDSFKFPEVAKKMVLLCNIEGLVKQEEKALCTFLKPAHSDLELAKVLNCLGQLHQRYKRDNEAIEAYKESMQIYNIALGRFNPQTATLLNKLGCLYFQMNSNNLAIQHFQQELLIELQLYKTYNSKVIVTLTNLAEIYKQEEDYEFSLTLYRNAAHMQEVVLGKDHLDTSITLSNLGHVLYQKGDFTESVTMYQRALKIRNQILSPNNDSDSASILIQLGLALIQLKEWSLALEALSESIHIRQSSIGRNAGCVGDEESAIAICCVGMIYENLGDEQQAIFNYEKALDIKRRILGCNHEEVARMLFLIGRIHMNMGTIDDLENALIKFNTALHIQKKKALDLSIARTLNCIGNVHFQRGEIDKSMQHFIEASRIHRELRVSDENFMFLNSNPIVYKLHSKVIAAAAA